ncbi:unnamed protein product [Arctogadus glacialis]
MISCCCLALLVLAAAAQEPCRAATCSQELPADFNEDSGRLRLLPFYCTNTSVCPQCLGWSEVGHVIRVYQKRVFRSDVIKKLLPDHFHALLHRLDKTLHDCAQCRKRSKEVLQFEKKIKRVQRKRKRREEGVFKASLVLTLDPIQDPVGPGPGRTLDPLRPGAGQDRTHAARPKTNQSDPFLRLVS